MTSQDLTNKKTALITGASSGIGYELARVFAREGHDLVLVARNQGVLNEVANRLKAEHGISAVVIAKDLSAISAPAEIYSELNEKKVPIGILVNNAGFPTRGKFSDSELDSQLKMMLVNMVALTILTRLFLDPMVKVGRGKILNVASTAAFQPGPLMAVYYATKAYVLSFSEALANELRGSGVTLTVLCPGPTETAFKSKAKMEGSNLFKGAMDPKKVAESGYQGMMKNKMLVIPGLGNRLLTSSARLVPRGLLIRMVRRMNENPSREV